MQQWIVDSRSFLGFTLWLDGYKENNACDFAIKESSLKSFFTPTSPVLLLLLWEPEIVDTSSFEIPSTASQRPVWIVVMRQKSSARTHPTKQREVWNVGSRRLSTIFLTAVKDNNTKLVLIAFIDVFHPRSACHVFIPYI